ncbi:MAG: hypothetical protein KJ808_07015 [Acidobacteria bacterium]|nr:hypothetical protein [Acidobacteriota bacterium]MBU4308124.1 hypothetical protein [Acidobacteriota bacterium]MCG2812557.1 hypothetical protein [Candidatus Aminicenantes bacterium]
MSSIPDSDHISHLCYRKDIDSGIILATAFMVRDKEPYLSVNWLEFLNRQNRNNAIEQVLGVYKKKFNKLRPDEKIALLNVGATKKKVKAESKDNREIGFCHIPNKGDPSHSGIFNIIEDKEFIAELIRSTIIDSIFIRDI